MPLSDSSFPSFLNYLHAWYESLPVYRWKDDVFREAGTPEAVAVFAVDTINAFAHEGSLASGRVRAMLPRLQRLMTDAYQSGISDFVIVVDSHSDEALEFRHFPAHAVRGTTEARLVPEVDSLPFRDLFTLFVKNSFHPAMGTSLEPWLMDNPQLTHFIVTGCGTDLGVYLLATYLHAYLLAHHLPGRVIVPADCTDTYVVEVDLAQKLGILPHPAELCHLIALYHLAIHGVTVVKDIR